LTTFIIRRLLFLFVVLFGVSVLIFGILMTFSPERRAAAYVSSPQQVKDIPILVKQLGLDDPFYIQYLRWVKEICAFNFGWSLVAAKPVWDAFLYYFPITLELNLFTAPLTIILGIWLGTLAGIHRDTYIDHSTRIFAIIGWSLPTFLFALIMLMIFYGYFDMFPPGIISDHLAMFIRENPDQFKQYTRMYTIDGILNGRLDITLDSLRHLAMPVFTQVVVVVALLMRVMRSSMIEEISKEYILTARAKGADRKTVYIKHARKNALIPVVTVAGWLVAFSMEGSISVEIIFNRQGIGWWLAQSAIALDIPVLMGVCLFFGLVYVIANLIIDILYAYIDPRIRLN
jgi:ABC-type dipeptide/oligopeptide/nickel transport system permease component